MKKTALLLISLIFSLTPIHRVQAATGLNNYLTFQGKMVNADGTNVTDGVYDFVFNIYDSAASTGSSQFTETWSNAALFTSTMSSAPGANGESLTYSSNTNETTLKAGQILWNTTKGEAVTIVSVNNGTNVLAISPTRQAWATSDTITNRIYVKDGIFRVALNSLNQSATFNTVFSDDTRFLGINFNADGEMKPRVRLTATPYAMNAASLGSVDATGFLRSNTSDNYTSGTLALDSGTTLDINGDVSIADTNIALDGASTTFTTTGAFTLTPGGAVTLGDGGDTLAINTSDWDISTTGTLTNTEWQGTAISTTYGGTGQNWSAVAQGSLPYFNGTGTMTTLAGSGTNGWVLKYNTATSVPYWAADTDTNTTYTAGNDIDFSGTQIDLEPILNYVTGVTLASGDLTLTTLAGNLVNISTGNLKVGNGTPGVTLNGEDAYIEGTFEVDGATQLDGNLTANGTLDGNGLFTLGDNGETGAIDTSDWDISTTGDMTGIGGITADGAIAFTPSSTSDVVLGVDTDSLFTLDSSVANADILVISPYNAGAGTFTGTLTSADLTGNVTWTLPATTGTLALTSDIPALQNLFATIDAPSGTDPVADSTTDTLQFIAGANVTITGDSTADSITIAATDTNTTYTAGNDIDFSGTQIDLESQLDYVTTISRASSNLALQTTTSGDITLTTGATTGLVNVLTGNLKVGNGTPGVALNGEDVYIEGALEVDSLANIGSMQLSGTTILSSNDDLTLIGGGGQSTRSSIILRNGGSVDIYGSSTLAGDITIDSRLAGNDIFLLTGNVGIGTTAPTHKFEVAGGDAAVLAQGDLRLYDTDNTNYSGFQANGTTTQNSVYTLPAAYPGGASGYFLTADTSGNMSWSNSVGTTYTAGNDIDFSGTQIDLEPILNYVTGVTLASGDLTLTTLAGNLVNISTGNLKVGNGTPGVTLNGEDAYIEGTFEVDGATQLDGNLTANGTLDGNGLFTLGDNGETGAIDTSDWDISTTGTLTNTEWQGTAISTTYGGTGQNWSAVAQGSLPYFNGTGTMTTLAGSGTNGWVLKYNTATSVPYWAADTDTNTTYTAGNDIDFSGTQIDLEPILNYVTGVTLASGDLTLTTLAGNLVNISTGNLKVGNGTPGVTLNGEDAYIEGTFEVDGATQLDGNLTANGTLDGNGLFTLGDNGETGAIDTSDWDISTTGTLTNTEWQGTAISTTYGGTGQNWSAVAQGSLPYFNGTGTMTTLAGSGTNGWVLKYNTATSVPYWAADAGATYTITNGLTESPAGTLKWGGTLTETTTVTQGAYNTVFNLDSTGDFDIQDNGTSAFFVKDNGYVGIGTTDPALPLDVASNLGMRVGSSTKNINIFTSGGGNDISSTHLLHLNYSNNQPVSIGEGGTSNLYVSGNVGIGTNNPGAKLDINVSQAGGTNTIGQRMIATTTSSGASTSYGTWNSAVSSHTTGTLTGLTGAYNRYYASGSGGTVSYAYATGLEQFVATGAIVTNGSGINLPTPNISGTGYISDVRGINISNMYNTASGTSTTGGYNARGINLTLPTQGGNTSGTNNNYGLYITGNGGTAGSGGTVNNYALYSASTANSYLAGSLGIGTTSPARKLSVVEEVAGTTGYNVPFDITSTTTGTAQNGFSTGIGFNLELDDGSTQNAGQIYGVWEDVTAANSAGGLVFRTSGSGTGNAERMRINNAGYVGIGTTSPASILHLSGPTNAQLYLQRSDSNIPNGSIYGLGTSAGAITYGSALALYNGNHQFYTDTTPTDTTNNIAEVMRLTSTGYLGIGTTSPTAMLTVANTAAFNSAGDTEIGYNLNFSNDTAAYIRSNSNLTIEAGDSSSAENLSLRSKGTGDVVIADNNVFTYAGNVGIGTTNPAEKLEVNGKILFTAGANSSYPTLGFDASGAWIQSSQSTDDLRLATANSERMRILASGNVGIGTTNPQQMLHVYRASDGAPVRFEDTNGYCEINPTSTTWTCTSDARLKKDVTSITKTDALKVINDLNPVTFHWNKESNDATKHLGFIAQEVEAVLPDLVTTDENGYKAVSYGSFVPLFAAALKQQQVELNTKLDSKFSLLSTNTTTQTNRLSDLIAKIEALFTRQDKVETDVAAIKTSTTQEVSLLKGDQASVSAALESYSARISYLETQATHQPAPEPISVATVAGAIDNLTSKVDLALELTASQSTLIASLLEPNQPPEPPVLDLNLDVESIFVSDFLSVMGDTILTDLTVTHNLTTASITSLDGKLDLMAGLINLDATGSLVTIDGNLVVKGKVTAAALDAPEITSLASASATLSAEIASLNTNNQVLGAQIVDLQQLVASLSAQIASLSSQLASPSASTPSATPVPTGSSRLAILGSVIP